MRPLLPRVIAVAGLTVVWVLLWDDLSLANTLLGVLLACLVIVVFPLPKLPYDGRVRPWGVLRYAVRFFADLVAASFEVAWLAIRPGGPPRSAIVTVDMRSRSEVQLSMTAITLTLVPGSLVLDVDRAEGRLHTHVLGVDDEADITAYRRSVLELEARVLRAVGSDAELAALRAEGDDPR